MFRCKYAMKLKVSPMAERIPDYVVDGCSPVIKP